MARGEGPNASSVTFTRKKGYAEADAGAYVLRTSHEDWSVERVVRTYWRLTEIESTFRALKTDLGLRPIWHVKPRRIAAHLFIAVLAFHGVHLLRTRLKAKGIPLSWGSLRRRLRRWGRITTTIEETNGGLIVNRQDVRPGAELANIARAVGVEPRLHRRRSRTRRD